MPDAPSFLLGDAGGRVHYLEPGDAPVCGTRVYRAVQAYEGAPGDVTCRRCLRLKAAGQVLHLELPDETIDKLKDLMRWTGQSASRILNDLIARDMRDRAGQRTHFGPAASEGQA